MGGGTNLEETLTEINGRLVAVDATNNAQDNELKTERINRTNKDTELENQIKALTDSSPQAVDNISKMTNHNKIYVLTTDGY